ncbi:hypothetical protein F4680DRAFT_463835 [Xylaria scruposa]|nr:hypothetical protein F4680DRAFT_463835 [Xylaria scruposa]
MDNLYWDPDNILQIIFDEEENAEFQCVGKTQHDGSRCRRTVPHFEQETAYELLFDLASTMPGKVLEIQLDTLAAICLCQHHSHQRQETVERWVGVVNRAAKQYEYLQRSAVEEHDKKLIADLSVLIAGEKSTSEESSQVIQMMKDTMSDLEGKKASLQEQLQNSRNVVNALNSMCDFWESMVGSLRGDIKWYTETIKTLVRQGEEFNNSIAHRLRSAGMEINGLDDKVQRLGTEIELRDQSLQQSRIELQQERDRCLILRDKVAAMEQRIMILEKGKTTG